MVSQVPIPPLEPLDLAHPTPDENYGLNLDNLEDLEKRYREELGKTVPNLQEYNLRTSVDLLVPNLVVLTNIYTGAIPKVLGDEPYRPQLVRFTGPDCVVKMVDYLRSYNKGNCYAFAHNGSGFDGKFIFDAVNQINGLQQTPILRGTNFISLKVHLAAGGKSTYFYDSMLHLPGGLANLLKGFFSNSPDPLLKGGKGYFPHKFNTSENQNYVGPIPEMSYFSPTQLPLGSGKDKWKALNSFESWHDEQQGLVWDFQKEFVKYCDMDVIGLAALLKVYMEISIPKGGIPLMQSTAPAFVHQLYLQRVAKGLVLPEVGHYALKKQIEQAEPTLSPSALSRKIKSVKAQNTRLYLAEIEERTMAGWVVLKPTEYNFVRRSLRGGRTVTTDSLMTLTDEERDAGIRILYQDVTSLYPAEQMTQKFACGPPTIHFYTWGFKPCYHCQNTVDVSGEFILECDCPLVPLVLDGVKGKKKGWAGTSITQVDCRDTQPTAESFMNDPEMFGYVCCDLTPPKNLFHPVIQIKKTIMKDGKPIGEKCQNNLVPEDHKKLYLDTPTLKYALEMGYKLDFVYRFDKYLSKAPLWKNCAMDFYTDKERTSGPKPSNTSKGEWCETFRTEFGTEPANDRQAYVDLYNHIVPELGDTLLTSMDTLEWSKQPAQRQVFKVFNNCGWGKHAQRPVMPKTQMIDVDDQYSDMVTLFENLTKNLVSLRGCLVYGNGKKLMFTVMDQNRDPNHHVTYLPAGAMVPAYGRLTLLKGLQICGDRVAMCK